MKYFYLFLLIAFSTSSFNQTEDNLPLLGDPSSAAISLSGEYELGRLWLSVFRSSVKEYEDPLTTTYLEDLIYRISETSEVRDRRYEFVIIDDESINAFAAPGGIIGVNKGMFLKTDFESEFASVMCHELAHLSQRHFARNVLPEINKISGGAVIRINSRDAPHTGIGIQTSQKRAIDGYMEVLFEDVREYGTKVCTINPGFVNTSMVNPERLNPELMMQPNDIAEAVNYVLNSSETACPTEILIQPQRSPWKKTDMHI